MKKKIGAFRVRWVCEGGGVMEFVGKEREVGYGIYWALIEYLWVRDNYVGDVESWKLVRAFEYFRRPTDVSPEELWAFRGDGLYLFCQEN